MVTLLATPLELKGMHFLFDKSTLAIILGHIADIVAFCVTTLCVRKSIDFPAVGRRRQGELCRWCTHRMAEAETTFDHDDCRVWERHDDRIEIDGKRKNAPRPQALQRRAGIEPLPHPQSIAESQKGGVVTRRQVALNVLGCRQFVGNRRCTQKGGKN
jgi:hypothetical protein